MTNNKKTYNFWQELSLDCVLLTPASLKSYLSIFWKKVMKDMGTKQVVYVSLKVKFDDGNYATFTKLQMVNKTMFHELFKTFKGFYDLRVENYSNKVMTNIIFQYHICSPKLDARTYLSLPEKQILKKVSSFTFVGYSLPVTTNLNLWGIISKKSNNNYTISKKGSSLSYVVNRFDQHQKVQVLTKSGKLLIEFTDIFGINPSSFTRILKDQEFVFENGIIKLKKLVRKTEFMSKIKVDKKLSNRFLTLDIETRTINNVMEPYCVSTYNGSKCNSFYLSDYNSPEVMLRTVIHSLLKTSYNGWRVYVHNLSNFDGIFLFRILSEIENTKLRPKMKDGKMISLKFDWSTDNTSGKVYSIEFRDSLLMLPNSLRDLSKAFNVENKGIFPYKFVGNNLEYVGQVPDRAYFDLNLLNYQLYKYNFNNNWDLRKESIKYCELDCRVLFEILKKFNELIFNKYQLNISRFPTLPSLAFGIFRAHYLVENQVPILNDKIFHEIRSGYTGGHTDVYKPQPAEGVKLFGYDVSSLYPYVMSKFPMPINKVTYFEGNILEFMSNPFGFFEVEVTTPEFMDRPLLQTKLETKYGFRTVAPLGKWKDMIFSEEMKEYIKHGYSFKIIRGYLFDQGIIFKDYVEDLYKIKQSESRNSPMYLISKLLMNSLYGRFGMTPYLTEHFIIDNSILEKLIDEGKFNDLECIDLNNGKSLLSFHPMISDIPIVNAQNVNISIAAAVTSYARIHMSQFLADPTLNIFYTDTDSIFIDRLLDSKFIGNVLGQMKLEYIANKAVFLAPKVYGLVLEDGTELVKVKGFKNPVSYSELESLLIKNNKLKLIQSKWYKSVIQGNISIKNEAYNLIATDSKRSLIHFKNKFIGTKPFVINYKKEI